MHQPRTYRDQHAPDGLHSFVVQVGESDCFFAATLPCEGEARRLLLCARAAIEAHAAATPGFLAALEPMAEPANLGHDPQNESILGLSQNAFISSQDAAPADMILGMYRATRVCGVGPMAAVAGAVAGYVGENLIKLPVFGGHSSEGAEISAPELIIENGGDLYLRLTRPRRVGLYAGPDSPFTNKIAIQIPPGVWGLATSAGSHGHALSFGKADAALVLARDVRGDGRTQDTPTGVLIPAAALADACATALGNRIKTAEDLAPAVEWVLGIEGVVGAVGTIGDRFAAAGAVQLI